MNEMSETVSVLFTVTELWLLQSVIRHECERYGDWRFAPAAVDLNDQIAAALLFCEQAGEIEAPLLLSRGDCLAIDYCVPNDAKDVDGKPVGRDLLMKTFAARQTLRDGVIPETTEPSAQPSADDVKAALSAPHELEEGWEYADFY